MAGRPKTRARREAEAAGIKIKTVEPHRPPQPPKLRPDEDLVLCSQEVLDRMAQGETVTQICKDLGFSFGQIWRLRQSSPEFAKAYTHARIAQTDAWMDGLVDDVTAHNDPQVAKLMVDTKKWIAAKRAPSDYGDKIGIEAGGKITLEVVYEQNRKVDENDQS